jgi:hypothetical protein
MNFSATSVAFAEIIEWVKGALRIAVVRHSFVINLTIVIEESKGVFEQRSFGFVEVATGSSNSFAVCEIFSDRPHGFASIETNFSQEPHQPKAARRSQ